MLNFQKKLGTERNPSPPSKLTQVIPQMPAAGWMAQFAQGLGLDLADAFTRHVKVAADLFQSMVFPI